MSMSVDILCRQTTLVDGPMCVAHGNYYKQQAPGTMAFMENCKYKYRQHPHVKQSLLE